MFTYYDHRLDELTHDYNDTGSNERAVELPIALYFLRGVVGTGVEVGNVLSHYEVSRSRFVIDKYEEGRDVINADIRDYSFSDVPWLISISTVEHIGWDDDHDPTGAIVALEHMQRFLASDGKMLVTVPLGWNPPLDEHLMDGAGSTRCCTLIRDNGWRQTKDLTFLPYVGNGHGADSVWIGEFNR